MTFGKHFFAPSVRKMAYAAYAAGAAYDEGCRMGERERFRGKTIYHSK